MTSRGGLTNIDSPEDILQGQTQLKPKAEASQVRIPEAYRSIRVLEESSGLLVGAHFLHADLLQRGACGVPLLTGDQGAGLMLVQKH